ncbi:MAG: glycosyltransferase family 4 protein [Flavobacteriaceae bacterium]|nr:glycosyltransferase family 4 protein [Flavobacteriaceae bacterium]MDG2275184.1 glycosyltransferase family 4 protein [Flavobacteriaceae bacterium]
MKKVLIIGPFPNPISGVSIANKVVEEILNADLNFIVEKINTSYPIFDEQIGEFSIQKFLFYLRINSLFFKVLRNNIIYITPGQTFFGVLKYALFIVAASALRKELIIHVHGNYLGKEYQSLKGTKRVLFYFLVSRFTKGIVLSNSLKQNLTPFLKDKNIFSLPNFAQDYLYTKDKKFVKDELRIFYLSNLMKEKGIFCLLNALKNLEKNNIIYKAKIAGNIDQNYSKEILKLFTELKNAEYIGIVNGDDKKSLLEWGNIFVLPTFYKMEGQPISILEAMATTNLVVTTNHAGISDVFQDKINGYFVEKNNENSIEKILSYLAANKSELKKIAEYNKRFFLNNFTVDIFKKNLLEIIK